MLPTDTQSLPHWPEWRPQVCRLTTEVLVRLPVIDGPAVERVNRQLLALSVVLASTGEGLARGFALLARSDESRVSDSRCRLSPRPVWREP